MALSENAVTRKEFRGVFACDQIPNDMGTLPLSFFVNMDHANLPGGQWIAFYQHGHGQLYQIFHSFDEPLSFYKVRNEKE